MSSDEKKGLGADDSQRAIERILALFRSGDYDVDGAVRNLESIAETARAAARDLEDAASRADVEARRIESRRGYSYSDRRPLDAKTIPGAHGTYR